MTNDETALEAAIKERRLTAARVMPEMIDAEITAEEYHVFPGTSLTVCVLTLQNGFTVTGESACASPENFDAEIGQRVARSKAREKIWPLLGFRLRDLLDNQLVTASAKGTEYPAEMTSELRQILGLMCFQTGPIAHLLRRAGAAINRKVEDEQAYVLHWLITLYLKHGHAWSEIYDEHMKQVSHDLDVKRIEAEGT